jgi:hypothetical protein
MKYKLFITLKLAYDLVLILLSILVQICCPNFYSCVVILLTFLKFEKVISLVKTPHTNSFKKHNENPHFVALTGNLKNI